MEEKKHSENWGGRREGAGRKAGVIQRKLYSKRLTVEEKAYLEECLAAYREEHQEGRAE